MTLVFDGSYFGESEGEPRYQELPDVKEPRLKAVTAIVPAISNIATSPMMGFFKPEEEVIKAKEAYDWREKVFTECMM